MADGAAHSSCRSDVIINENSFGLYTTNRCDYTTFYATRSQIILHSACERDSSQNISVVLPGFAFGAKRSFLPGGVPITQHADYESKQKYFVP